MAATPTRTPVLRLLTVLLAAAALAACGTTTPAQRALPTTATTATMATSTGPPRSSATPPTVIRPATTTATTVTITTPTVTITTTTIASIAASGPDLGPLRGKTIAVDPGHNGGNFTHAATINRAVFVGNGSKACDTTGTATRDGYTEAAYNFDVATRLAALLRGAGASVVLTRPDNNGVGPCITERAAIANAARADAAISVHADGGPASGRGFHVIEPAPVAGYNTAIVAPSARLALAVRREYQAATGEPFSTYAGTNALETRSDLGGLNLSTVPKVFIETANMANTEDAALVQSPAFRQKVAQGLAQALADFLAGR